VKKDVRIYTALFHWYKIVKKQSLFITTKPIHVVAREQGEGLNWKEAKAVWKECRGRR
jgi:hypothetical protein